MNSNCVINQEVFASFEKHLQAEEKSEQTISKYLHEARVFVDFLKGDGLNRERMIAYKARLLECGFHARTVNAKLSALNAFLRFVGREDCLVRTVRVQRQIFCRESRELSRTEFEKLCNAARNIGNRRLLASFVFLAFIVIRRLIFGDPVAGWASLFCAIIFIGGVQLACLGIMGQYLAKTFLEAKKRPHYIVAESNADKVKYVN